MLWLPQDQGPIGGCRDLETSERSSGLLPVQIERLHPLPGDVEPCVRGHTGGPTLPACNVGGIRDGTFRLKNNMYLVFGNI